VKWRHDGDKIRLAVLAGDGIGPEITDATVRVLQAAAGRSGLDLALTPYPIGWKAYEQSRSTLTPETLAALRNIWAGFSVLPLPANTLTTIRSRGIRAANLRRNFALFANVRPVQAWPPARAAHSRPRHHHPAREHGRPFIRTAISPGAMASSSRPEDVGISLRVITAPSCERFARFAFEYAATANIDRLAVVHKRTALPQTEGLFIGAFERLHPEYPNIALELVRIDTFSSAFPRDPHRYRLVATTNLFGDILSDQASGLAGGVGIAPS